MAQNKSLVTDLNSSSGGRSIPLWIDNKPITSDIVFDVINAERGTTVHTAYGATPEIAKQAVESAQEAFLEWRKTDPWHRRKLLQKAADYLRSHRSDVMEIFELEVPTFDGSMDGNLRLAIGYLEELAGSIPTATNGAIPHTENASTYAMVVKEPYGVNIGIAPWNAPLFLAIRAVMTPIACGNTAILKASELSPGVHHMLAKMALEAGFPPGVLNVVQSRREDAAEILETLVSHAAVKKVNFTGSTGVGQIIAETASRYHKPTVMELGGKNPQIVLEDADLDKAARAAIVGGFLHHGQICMSADAVIAHKSIAQELLQKMTDFSSSWKMTAAATELGAKKTEDLIIDAVSKGATIANRFNIPLETTKDVSNGLLRQSTATLHPVILTGVTPDMKIYCEESFGPVIMLFEFTAEDEAIELANKSIYGLSSSVFTRNVPRGLKIARKIDSGAVHINSMTIHDEPQLPHGGMKSSGWGRFGVPWGFDEFLQLKTITITSDDLVL